MVSSRCRWVTGRWFAIASEDDVKDDREQHDVDGSGLTTVGDHESKDVREERVIVLMA